jgi:RNA polymerase sigma-70 factor (ECF subfamily)
LGKSREHEGPALTSLSDAVLLERLSRGDDASFETLFYRHYDRVYGLLFRLVGNRVEAEDLTQEAFLKLYDHAFGQRRFMSRRDHNIGAWLYRVATNLGYNWLRAQKRRWQRNVLLVPEPGGETVAEKAVEDRETQAAVRSALSRLSARQTQLLLMRQMGLTYAECAEACGVSATSVGTLLARAAEAFRKAYGEETGGER